ncbi:hypothetical protein ILUMI_15563, partial [Ignelater luminosus]
MAVIGGPVKLPPDFDLQSSNTANEWKFWKSTFEDYLVATGQDKKINEDKALRDKILIGIRDPSTNLLRINQLTLEKAITFCRTSEQKEQEREKYD